MNLPTAGSREHLLSVDCLARLSLTSIASWTFPRKVTRSCCSPTARPITGLCSRKVSAVTGGTFKSVWIMAANLSDQLALFNQYDNEY